jgi:zinc transporter
VNSQSQPHLSPASGLVFAYRLDRTGGGRLIKPDEVASSWQEEAFDWLHFDRRYKGMEDWLSAHTNLDPPAVQFLLGGNPRPRVLVHGDEVLMSLRGLIPDPGAPPDDMHSIQIWTDGRRIITCRKRQHSAIASVRQAIERGDAPTDPGDMLSRLGELLATEMDSVIAEAEALTHSLGHRGASGHAEDLVGELAHLRRRMIRLQRYLAPQRRALVNLASSGVSWLDTEERRLLRAVGEQTAEYSDGLHAALEIAEITQDELLQRSSERTNRRLYMLTILSATFLPLTFLTGLLGINVAGIPDAENPLAFALVCTLLALIVLLELWVFKRKGWLGQ